MKLRIPFQELFTFIGLILCVQGLRNVSLSVPGTVLAGTSVTLKCHYILDSELYSVRWYKKSFEFFRYYSKEMPHIKIFPVRGIQVDVNSSGPETVVLKDVEYGTSGKYSCEVSEETSFFTAVTSSDLQVVYLPDTNPEITLSKREYAVGDILYANCTTPPASPAANATWRINGKKVKTSFIYQGAATEWEGVSSKNFFKRVTLIGLEKQVVGSLFQDGKMKIECEVTLYDLYAQRASEIVREDESHLYATEEQTEPNSLGHSRNQVVHITIFTLPLIIMLLNT